MENGQTTVADWQKTPIGSETAKKLDPVNVTVEIVERVNVKTDSEMYEKIILHVRHPSRDKLLKIGEVKFQKGDRLVTKTLWYMLDTQGQIMKNSALANFMRFYNLGNLSQAVGLSVMTTPDENGFLVVKAY